MSIVAAIQMTSSSVFADNLLMAASLIEQAAAKKATLVLLPENFALMAESAKQRLQHAELINDGPAQTLLSSLAKKHQIWIIAGALAIKSTDQLSTPAQKVSSACLVYNPDGKLVQRYNKQHLFDVNLANNESYKESDYIEAGTQNHVIETPAGITGLSICYDLRFPEMYRNLLTQSIDTIIVPAAFTYTTGKAHWEVLLRARAIENQVFVIAANQTGTHDNGRRTYGHSMIINPWGEIIAKAAEEVEVITADIDLTSIARYRNQLPCLQHIRY